MRQSPQGNPTADRVTRRRKCIEQCASAGLILVAIALIVPLFNMLNPAYMVWCKWVYALGALIFTAARVLNVNADGEPRRLRRLRRIEAWAGIAFIFGAAFWFYNGVHLGEFAGSLAIMRPTVMLTLAGAVIQIVASVLIVRVASKTQDN